MNNPSFYNIGDCVEIMRGRHAGEKGYISQIRKRIVVVSVRAKRATYNVRARSILLRKKSNPMQTPCLIVGADAITSYINDSTSDHNLHAINLGEWRRLQKEVERDLFDAEL